MDAKLSVASVRPARTEEDLARAEEFLKTPRVREIVEGHPEERGCVRLCESGGELLGALLVDPTSLRLRDTDVRCARLCETAGEDGRMRFRTTGQDDLFEFMVEEFLGYVWARCYPLAYVHGELALYPGFGFVPCFYHPRVFVEVSAALRIEAPYRVRLLKSDDIHRLDDLRRRDQRWKPAVFAAGVPMFHHFCIEDKEREIKGCFSLEADPEARWNSRFFAPEADVADLAAAGTLLRHCAEKAAELGLEQIHFPLGPGHPVARLCLELGGHAALRSAASDPCLNEEMLHLPEPWRLGEAFGPYWQKRLKGAGAQGLRESVPVVTERGQWAFVVEEGRARIDSLDRRPEQALALPHWMLVQLLAGYRSVDELDTELEPDQRALLQLLLPRTWPYSMPDADHWSTRMPPVPLSRQALAAIENIHLPWAPSHAAGGG